MLTDTDIKLEEEEEKKDSTGENNESIIYQEQRKEKGTRRGAGQWRDAVTNHIR